MHVQPSRSQAGATLIEVLVAVLILSFGALALSSMMAFAVQKPKLAAYRATASNLASSHIEKIRANPAGFFNGDYSKPLSYDNTFNPIGATAAGTCTFPCTFSQMADVDSETTNRAARSQLPAGGMLTACDPESCAAGAQGNLWIVWQDPLANAAVDARNSDHCPTQVTSRNWVPAPRCLYVRFRP